ncbi:MAG: hypothetical protein IIB44_10020 [Candidatus Marinimicrobia bacterium]|nr:hypothetical protein [Candidatus Neomarinimicrobiota bacterium]
MHLKILGLQEKRSVDRSGVAGVVEVGLIDDSPGGAQVGVCADTEARDRDR